MTCRWLICFSLASLHLLGAQTTGKVTGSIALRDSQMPAVKQGHDNSGVVVSFTPVAPTTFPPASKHAVMLQKNKMFLPHVLPVLAGSFIDFPNDDPIFHNAFSNYSGQVFDVGLYPPGTRRSVRFTRPGVVRVFCNIHAAMSAVIVVLETPYFATSDKSGSWQVDLPPGEYQMHVFHERAKDSTLQSLSRRVTVAASEPVTIGTISLSEAGYLPAPHMNKFGKQYPEGSGDDKNYYPGARK